MNFFPHHQRRIDVLSEILITTRQAKRLTTKQVAARLGKPEAFVLDYESGKYRLDLPELVDTLTRCVPEKIQVTDAWLSTQNKFFGITLSKQPKFGSNSPDTQASETAPDMTS